jgi:hypothetical protein
VVHPADIQDRDGGVVVLSTLFGLYPFLSKLFADGGYQGPQFCKAQKKALPHLATEIVKRSDCATGFEVLPTLGRRPNLRVARPVSTAGERLRKSIPQCFGVPPPRFNPHHATKALF